MAAEPVEKVRRQEAILAVLRQGAIPSQEGLRRALRRLGHPVTQATLSRDLRELRAARVATQAGYRYAVPGDEAGLGAGAGAAASPAPRRMRSVAAMEVRAIDGNETCVVVRTLTGRAQGVAVYIDGLRLPDVLATVAGDDTILVLPRSVRRTGKVREKLAELFEID